MNTTIEKSLKAAVAVLAGAAIAFGTAQTANAQPPDDQGGYHRGEGRGNGPGHGGGKGGPRRGPSIEHFDTDGDGKLSYEEATALPRMDEALFKKSDANGDGFLTKEEMPRPPRFEDLDTDADGKVSYEEASVLPHMTQEHFTEIDANGDGFLTKEERPGPPQGGPGERGDKRMGPPNDGDMPPPPDGEMGPPPDGQGKGMRGDRRGPPRFEDLDTDGNGSLSYDEAKALPRMNEGHFTALDANSDGALTQDELPPPPRRGPRPPQE